MLSKIFILPEYLNLHFHKAPKNDIKLFESIWFNIFLHHIGFWKWKFIFIRDFLIHLQLNHNHCVINII